MKYRIQFVALMLAISMGACSSDEILQNEEYQLYIENEIIDIVAVTGSFDATSCGSRTTIVMGESTIDKPVWAEKDTIGIYPIDEENQQPNGDQLSFPIVNGVGTSTCTFDGGGWALKNAKSYIAYSPFNRAYYYKDVDKLSVSMLGQKQIGNGSTAHMGKYDLQIAKATTPENGKVKFQFQHQVCFLRMDITVPIAATWKSITLESDASFTTEASMNIASLTPTITPTSTSKQITLELENVTTTSDDLSIVAYMMLLPIDLTNKSLSIKLTDSDENTYVTEASITSTNHNFGAAKARWINATFCQKTVILSDAGLLSSKLSDEEKLNLTSLRIEGPLNGDDIKLLRQMTGCLYFDQTGVLENLDLSKASIVSGGSAYYSQEYTTDNVIGKNMFYSSKLNKISLPTNITSIGESAFNNSNISTIVVPNSVTSIGSSAFMDCTNLETCILPNLLTKIESATFQRCVKLKSLEIPNGVIHIYEWAFNGCTNLTKIELPEIFYYIGESAFRNCINLKSINIPSTVTNIKEYAFAYCSELSSPLVIPSKVHTLGNYAFSGCSKLPSITILGSLSYTGIGEHAFERCTSLNLVVLSDNITTIGRYAFYLCEGITSVTLPNNLKTIKDYAFQGCSNLVTLTIPAEVESIGRYAFQSSTSQLTEIYCLPTIPPSIIAGEFCFDSSIYNKCKLYVPANSLNKYQSEKYWQSFKNIIAI